MIRYIISRPIGTSVIMLTLVIFGIISTFFIPVSLLPDIPVPEITVQAYYPTADARQIQKLLAVPLKNRLLQLDKIEDLEAISQDGQVTVRVRFKYGTDIDLAYLEANEKVDLLMESLPRDTNRPQVIKTGAGDLPVFQLNVSYKRDSGDFLALSSFCTNLLQRRLEQMPEIALVDITGLAKAEISVKLNLDAARNYGLSQENLIRQIQSQSNDLGNVTIENGLYEYNIRFEAQLKTVDDIRNLYYRIGGEQGRLVRLGDIAKVEIIEQNTGGLYMYNGKRAIGMAIIKQSDAQVLHLKNKMDETLSILRSEHPELDFAINLDQTQLLDLSISNLINSLLTGAFLSFILILFFMKDRKVLFIIGIIIPISLSITLLGFYICDLSINIVSLAGLVLGVGEIVDCGIIIIENIEQRKVLQTSNSRDALAATCITGTEEVIRPLITSILTNSLVFLPLIFLSGIAGTLFFDQAIAVTLSLGVSLFTSYTLIPIVYFLLFQSENSVVRKSTKSTRAVQQLYQSVFTFSFKRPGVLISLWLLLALAAGFVAVKIEKTGMPEISRTDLDTFIDWNESVSAAEGLRRIAVLTEGITDKANNIAAFVGQQQFLLNSRLQLSPSQALIVSNVPSTVLYDSIAFELESRIRRTYPLATFENKPSLNVFEQLLRTTDPPLRMTLSQMNTDLPPSLALIDSVGNVLSSKNIETQKPPRKGRILLKVRTNKLAIYDVNFDDLIYVLRVALNEFTIGQIKTDQLQLPILIGADGVSGGIMEVLKTQFVPNANGSMIPVSELISLSKTEDYSSLHLGKDGMFVPLVPSNIRDDIKETQNKIFNVMSSFPGINTDFDGKYFRDKNFISELKWIIIIAIGMLFFVLAAQFESLQQPFIVLITIVFGIGGSLIALYALGESLNIMSSIGLVVLIGLLDNDSILKLDIMNRNRDRISLVEVIKLGGEKRLQSQIMTFLTTELGLLPLLWSGGLGAELQKSLAIAVMAGMLVGVLISWTFIPLAYYWMYKLKSLGNSE